MTKDRKENIKNLLKHKIEESKLNITNIEVKDNEWDGLIKMISYDFLSDDMIARQIFDTIKKYYIKNTQTIYGNIKIKYLKHEQCLLIKVNIIEN